MANPKAFLHEWCAKNCLDPQFEIKQAGNIILCILSSI